MPRRTLIRNALVVSADPARPRQEHGDILIDGARIAAIGDCPPADDAEVIDAAGMIAMPGFVNAHIHTWQAGLRGIAADWTLADYLRAMHAGLATHFRPEDIEIANHVGRLNQLDAGVTTIADWCHNNPTPAHTDAAIAGLRAAGGRAVFLHGSPKPDPKPGRPHFSEIPMPRAEIERLRRGELADDGALVTLGLAILGPQMSVARVTRADLALARDFGLRASMHVSGPLLWSGGFAELAAEGLLGPDLNVTHGNALSDDDLRRLAGAGVSFSLTPEVELQMGFGEPLTNRLRALGADARISLGTDIESAMAGDMIAVARFALQSARHDLTRAARAASGKPPAEVGPTVAEALGWATIGGARMLGLDDRTGTLTPGKAADILLLSPPRPVIDPVASIVFHANPAHVDSVFVAGQAVKRGGRMLVLGIDALFERLEASSRRILSEFGMGK